jgi:hypothetical protein
MTTTRKLPDALPMQTRAAMVDSDSIDAVARTVTLVWTTGATVRRHRWEGWDTIVPFDETLVVTPSAIDLARMNAGAPVLDSHSTWSTFSQVAVVERAWIERGEGWATIRFPAEGIDAAADRLFGLVSERIVKNISVGYTINKLRIVEPEKKGEIEQHIVERWTPHEISFVTVPADPKAQVRGSEPTALYPLDIEHKEDGLSEAAESAAVQAEPSNDNNQQESRVADTVIENRAAPAGVDEAAVRAISDEAVRVGGIAERKRAAEIRKLGKEAGEPDLADAAIDNGDTVEAFRSALLEALMKREAPATESTVKVGTEHHEKRAKLMEAAIEYRANPGMAPPDGVGEYRGYTLLDFAREALENRGEGVRGLSREEIASRALAQRSGAYMTTSDFPIILGNVINTTLRKAYEAAPQTWRPFTRVTSVPDFKSVHRTQLGEAPRLEKVNEHGEFKRGKFSEAKEIYAAASYGKIIALSRQAIINDNMDAFNRIPGQFGVAVAQLESDLVYAQILGNPVMGDGQNLFSAAHSNYVDTTGKVKLSAAGAAAGISLGRKMMAKQTGIDKQFVLNLTPAFLLAPLEVSAEVEKILYGSVYAAKKDDVVPQSVRALTPIFDARLDNGLVNPVSGATILGDADNWYMIANPALIDTVELAYLEGQQGMFTETRAGFDVDGLEVKVRFDAGAKVIDWRGFHMNVGD